MNCYSTDPRGRGRILTYSTRVLTAVFFLMLAAKVGFGMNEPLPAQLSEVKMGMSQSPLIDKIKSTGTHTVEVSPWDKRTKIVWQLPDNPYYNNVMFLFTEKDRLYIVRFAVKQEARPEVRILKKALLHRFGISSEGAPGRLRIKNQDVLVYEGSNLDRSLFEFTDTKTGEKSLELYDRKVSSEDKPKKDTENKSDGQK